jgi:hypothetical protein
MQDVKHFWASRTIWVQVLALIAALSGALGLDLGFTPEVQASAVVTIMAVVNIILRFITSTAVR